MTYIGARALLDAGFAIGLLIIIIYLSYALGIKVLHFFPLDKFLDIEILIFSVPLGMGLIAYGVLGLGIIGLLNPWAILLWLLLIGYISFRDGILQLGDLLPYSINWKHLWNIRESWEKVFLIIGGIILILTFIQTLAPPWDTDGLMYHLKGPDIFLHNNRIMPLPDIWGANGPFTVEMLFTIGMAFGSDVLSKLIHLTYALLLVLCTYSFGCNFIGRRFGWIAAAILVGIPIFPFWASFAYVDIAWATYEFLAIYLFFKWIRDPRINWLILAGMMMGFALGIKYFALGGAFLLGLAISWFSRHSGLKTIIRNCLSFGVTAIIIGSPWYLKNLFYTGNPVYPLLFGGLEWPVERVEWLMIYLRSFGVGWKFYDILLLPINLYVQHERFSTISGNIEMMSLLFPLIILMPILRIQKLLWLLLVLAFGKGFLWLFGSQQIRFLLPIFPILSIITASVLIEIGNRLKNDKISRILRAGLLVGVVSATLIYSILYFINVNPLPVVLGNEAKEDFLKRRVAGYSAKKYIQENLPHNSKVLLVWSGQSYYCDERCLPDTEHNRWTQISTRHSDIRGISTELRAMGITHLLLNYQDLDFILLHDPTHQHYQAADLLLNNFSQSCTNEIYQDQWNILFEIDCVELKIESAIAEQG
jgi:4-amino-4-deoxy-L-arabinose transferase-like glycosyltransferase